MLGICTHVNKYWDLKYKYPSLKYEYKYKYSGLKYKYKYKYFKHVLEYKYKYQVHISGNVSLYFENDTSETATEDAIHLTVPFPMTLSDQ